MTADVQAAVYGRDLSVMGGTANGLKISCENKSAAYARADNSGCANIILHDSFDMEMIRVVLIK